MALSRITTALAVLALIAYSLVAIVLLSALASRCSAASRDRCRCFARRRQPLTYPLRS